MSERPAQGRAVRDSLALGVPVGLYGVAFGAAAVSGGLSVAQASVLSLVLFSGGSQFALVGVLAGGGSAVAGVGAALLLGARNTLYALRLAPVLRVRGLRRVVAAHGVIDESTAMAVAQPDDAGARTAFRVTALTIFVMWNFSTVLGALAAGGLPDVARAALDAVVPAAFLALLWPRLRQGADQRWAALAGAVIAAVGVLLLPPGVGVLAASLGAVLVLLVRVSRERR